MHFIVKGRKGEHGKKREGRRDVRRVQRGPPRIWKSWILRVGVGDVEIMEEEVSRERRATPEILDCLVMTEKMAARAKMVFDGIPGRPGKLGDEGIKGATGTPGIPGLLGSPGPIGPRGPMVLKEGVDQGRKRRTRGSWN
ncbi:hypothetical protein OS493_031806 [Desmophyllum pertusum]|uniref:Uncharacterized protein n=1 Tax=Desmophyllum pertusum TaxID=174260 RepID=A0A9W9YYT8_9CNID|nr:hypothetical protein OS493_031806 [Desmophyllum pertusum]